MTEGRQHRRKTTAITRESPFPAIVAADCRFCRSVNI